MGGDDLASDDEYLFESGVIHPSSGRGTTVASPINDDESDDETTGQEQLISSKNKRKSSKAADQTEISSRGGGFPTSKSKRRKKINDSGALSSSKNILIHAGRGISNDGAEAQAMFLGTLYSHFTKISAGSNGSINANDDDDDRSKSDEKNEKTIANAENFIFQSKHFFASQNKQQHNASSNYHSSNMATFLKSGSLPSMKRLKNWKHPNSPMVLVITLSARRSVELMKQLSTLRLPIAKLFAKHMNVDDQVELLCGGFGKKKGDSGIGGRGKEKGKSSLKCYGIGVGTPGRLLTLLHHGKNESNCGGALRLNHTEVIVIDCQEDSKGFNVCTLKDTSKELMEFIKEGVVPELRKRAGNIKLALF